MKKYKMIDAPTLIGTSHQDLREVKNHGDLIIRCRPISGAPDQISVTFTIVPENGIIEPGDLTEIAEHLEKYFNQINRFNGLDKH